MSRYIDADAVKKDIARLHVLNDEAEIRRTYEYNPHVTTTDFEETLVSVFDAIDDAPSIDIVRCKECKWYTEDKGCLLEDNSTRTPDDYCSYGERKDKCKECWYWSEVHKRCENKCGCQFKPYGERSRR